METFRVIEGSSIITIKAISKEEAYRKIYFTYGFTPTYLEKLPYFKYSSFHKYYAIQNERSLWNS